MVLYIGRIVAAFLTGLSGNVLGRARTALQWALGALAAALVGSILLSGTLYASVLALFLTIAGLPYIGAAWIAAGALLLGAMIAFGVAGVCARHIR